MDYTCIWVTRVHVPTERQLVRKTNWDCSNMSLFVKKFALRKLTWKLLGQNLIGLTAVDCWWSLIPKVCINVDVYHKLILIIISIIITIYKDNLIYQFYLPSLKFTTLVHSMVCLQFTCAYTSCIHPCNQVTGGIDQCKYRMI